MTAPWARLCSSILMGLGVVLGSGTALAVPLLVDGAVTTNTCPGGTAINGGRGCSYGGTHEFDSITLQNGAVIEVVTFPLRTNGTGGDKNTQGNLVLKSLGNINIDATSRITARGRGYQARDCDDGDGPNATAGGRGGCSVRDSGGGAAHFGRGGKGTKDCFIYPGGGGTEDVTCTFPHEWEEDCSSRNGNSCVDDADQDPNTGGNQCYGSSMSTADFSGDELPAVSGQSYWHHILDAEFGAAGGDKGCRDGYESGSRGGNGGGRIVLFAGASGSVVNISGRVTADGNRGCALGNDSAGGGAGGTILIIGDTVNVLPTARISARGGRGGDSQPKGLACTYNPAWTYPQQGSCGSGQLCRQLVEPASGNTYARCDPANCVPARRSPASAPGSITECDAGYTVRDLGGGLGRVCIPTAYDPFPMSSCNGDNDCLDAGECTAPQGCDCMNFSVMGSRCVPKNQPICDYLDFGENESECSGAQNSGTCDDCAGGGGGGIINVQSRVNNIDPRSIFDVRGGNGGICPICAGEAGAGAGELQIDAAYVGEICDGKDNDFDGTSDEGIPDLVCPTGTIDACVNGVPSTCPTLTQCNQPVTDTRPRFALVVDTSGSMLLDNDGEPRFGDGSDEFPGINGTETRLYNAKGALSDVLAAFPESDYALARYYQDTGLNRSCQTANWFECAQSCCSYDDPTTAAMSMADPNHNVSPAYPYYYPDGQCIPSQLYDSGNSTADSLEALSSNINIGWQTPTADCINYSGSCGPPERGAQYLVDFAQPLGSYLSWLDNHEDNFVSSTQCPGGDCELRGTGPTPLASSLQATEAFLTPRIACDNAVPCRKYNVILLTDGAESCQGDPVAAAAALNAGILKNIGGMMTPVSVKTYVIGFSTLPTETTQLNAIAAAGGTTAAYFVASRAELANALATIISDSFVFEKCNGMDDDCDGQIDEDFPETNPPTGPGDACDDGELGACRGTGHYVCKDDGTGSECEIDMAGATPGTEVCNGIDDNCNGLIDESTPQNPLNCEPCIALPEVCDGADNDCDMQIDEVADLVDDNQPCGTDIGQCSPGSTVCVDGELECQGAMGPFTEICDGADNDCDNVIDGMSEACYVATGNPYNSDPQSYQNPVCRRGTWKCTAGVWGSNMSAASCVGQIVPTQEVCDGKDNDCDATVDDNIAYPGGGVTGDQCCDDKVTAPAICGTGQCSRGTLACVGPVVMCVGGGTPSVEVCDTMDNDCNGEVDDIPSLGQPCQTPGGCPGTLQCTGNQLQCVADGTEGLEVCNGLDDDCDGSVDELPDINDNDDRLQQPCDQPEAPNDQPPCMAGTTFCNSGAIDCQGAVGPLDEVCDLKDNDCDGVGDTLAACPGVNACVQGVCVEPCHGGEFPCPGGYDCQSFPDENGDMKKVCVPLTCNDVECPPGATCRDGACTLDGAGGAGSGDGGMGNDAGGPGQAGTPGSSDGGMPNGSAGDGNEPVAGSSSGGSSSGTGSGATGNSGVDDERGIYGLVTGGGGCACRTTPSRGGPLALGLSLLMVGAFFTRRRREGSRRAA